MKKHVLILLLLFTFSSLSYAQRTIQGKVADQSGEPMIGVSVAVQGTTIGTLSDVNGSFSISANPEQILVFSFIGFATKSVRVGNQISLNIVLEEGDNNLDEVVVTALGISKEKRSLGYATSVIESKDITRTANTNLATALYGKAPGVNISATSGGATSGVSISIRGFSSITGNTQPLIVLNGVPIRNGNFDNTNYWEDQRIRGNGLLDINPADIENISILKGASAAALYGSEAVNGVMLITTKSGKGASGLGIDFNSSYTFDKISYLPRYQNVRGPGYLTNFSNRGQNEDMFIVDNDGTRNLIRTSLNFGPKFDSKPVRAWTGDIVPYEASNGSYADLFQNANSSNVNLGITKAGDFGSFRIAFTRQDNQMISRNSKNEKNIANITATFRIGKRSSSDLNLMYINQFTKNRPFKVERMINNFGGMMDRFEHADWYFDRAISSLGYRYTTDNQATLTPNESIKTTKSGHFKNDLMEYAYEVLSRDYREYSNRILASFTENFQITKGLNFRGRLATDFTSERFTDKRPNTRPLALGTPTGLFRQDNNLYNLFYGDVYLNYIKKLSSTLEVTALAGYTARRQRDNLIYIKTEDGLSPENLFDITASVNSPKTVLERKNQVTDAFLGTLGLNYNGYLNIEGTIRRDRTSTMAPGFNTFTYPSVNAAFVFSEAFKLPTSVSYSKLRASWGIVGNYPAIYEANITYEQKSLLKQGGTQPTSYTIVSKKYGNNRIRPEQKHEIEFGWETQFLKRRLGFDLSYYNAKVVDQILPLSLPSSSGAESVLTNIGTLRNQGIELALNAVPFKRNNFQWNVILNTAKNKNKVEKLANSSRELLHKDYDGNAAQLRSIVGKSMGDIFVHPIATDDKGNKIVGSDGLYELDGNKWIIAGNAMPKVTGGLINSLVYKNFSLDIVTDFRIGGSIMPTGIAWLNSRGLTEESLNYMDTEHGGLSYYLDKNGKGTQATAAGAQGQTIYHDGVLLEGVTIDGAPNTNVIPQALYYVATYNWGGPQYGNSRYELYVKDNSYVKMRELSLSYALPNNIARYIGAKNLSVSTFGRNLFFFYRNIKDLDPEQITAGSKWVDNINNAGNNPAFRSFGLVVKANF